MSIIYIMIPLGVVLVCLAVWAMVWAVRSGQFDELESHGWDPVLDDDERPLAQEDQSSTDRRPESSVKPADDGAGSA